MTTALITGASSGIGQGFAERYAALGHDLVLVARREDRLRQLAERLEAQRGVGVEVLVADLASADGCARVEARVADDARPIDVLVNNAGFSLGTDLVHSDVDAEEAMLMVMARAPLRLTKAALPVMLARRSGTLIMVASVAGIVSYNSYGAVKSWALRFSEALALALQGTGVRAIALCPGMTRTEFHDAGSVDVQGVPRSLWLSVDQVVADCLRDLDRGRIVSIPDWKYRVITGVGRVLPSSVAARIARSRGRRRRPPSSR